MLFRTVNTAIGQLMVVMFFFYSGYGVAAQLIKRPDYMKDFLVRRLFQVWLRFAVCVVFFVILNMLMGTLGQYSRLHIVLAFSGYTAIGNSNWFMFDTFVLYFLCWLVFFWHGRLMVSALAAFTLLAAGFNYWLYCTQPSWWWNTLIVFPLGMYLRRKKGRYIRRRMRRVLIQYMRGNITFHKHRKYFSFAFPRSMHFAKRIFHLWQTISRSQNHA